jgi:tripartite ATP-independent transporter DctM subunit
MPIGYVLALVGAAGIALASSIPALLTISGQSAFDTVTNSNLVVLPLFLLMGNVLAYSGMAQDLYAGFNALLGRRRGGLAIATILSCGAFSSVCGSSLATTATMSRVSIPSMIRFGYDPAFSAGVVAAGGTLGILIPPSVVFIIYGILTESNIGHLFIAGIIPGLIGIAFYIAAIQIVITLRPQAAGRGGSAAPDPADLSRALRGFVPVLLLLFFVIAGIYAGAFTATEAAGMGAGFAILYALVTRALSLARLVDALYESARATAMMLFLLMGAILFSHFLELARFTQDLAAYVTALKIPTPALIAIILLIYIVLGCFLESLSMILLTVPILYPIMKAHGVDLVWFGVLVVVVTEIALITPPIGLNIFVLHSVQPQIPIGTIFRGVVPFILVDFVRLALLALFPALSLWLVRGMG